MAQGEACFKFRNNTEPRQLLFHLKHTKRSRSRRESYLTLDHSINFNDAAITVSVLAVFTRIALDHMDWRKGLSWRLGWCERDTGRSRSLMYEAECGFILIWTQAWKLDEISSMRSWHYFLSKLSEPPNREKECTIKRPEHSSTFLFGLTTSRKIGHVTHCRIKSPLARISLPLCLRYNLKFHNM